MDLLPKKLKEMKDEELVSMAGSINSAQAAQAELLRRNTEAIVNMGKSTYKFSNVTTGLTLIMMAFVVLQIIFAIYSATFQLPLKIIFTIGFLLFTFYIFRDFLRGLKED